MRVELGMEHVTLRAELDMEHVTMRAELDMRVHLYLLEYP